MRMDLLGSENMQFPDPTELEKNPLSEETAQNDWILRKWSKQGELIGVRENDHGTPADRGQFHQEETTVKPGPGPRVISKAPLASLASTSWCKAGARGEPTRHAVKAARV